MNYINTLSNKQKKVLDYITEYIGKFGYSPLIEEIKADLNFKSTRSVSQYLEALVKKRYIKKDRSPRSIQLVDYYKNIENKTELIPMYGLASCGTPEFYADNNIEEHIPVDKGLLKEGVENYYIIRASGSSMDNAGINDASLVLLEKKDSYDSNEKVLAVVDGLATIKKVFKGDSAIMLMPESSDDRHKPIIVNENFAIAGKVICTLPDPSLIDEPRYVNIENTL